MRPFMCVSENQTVQLKKYGGSIISSFKISSQITNRLDSLIHSFLWVSKERKCIHRIRKSITDLPKGMRGLGIRFIVVDNKFFLMKKAWHIYSNPKALISRVFSSIKPNDLGSEKFVHKSGSLRSWGFHGIQLVEKTIFQNLAWKIGNGQRVSSFSKNWNNGKVPTAKDNVTLHQIQISKVSDFIEHSHS